MSFPFLFLVGLDSYLDLGCLDLHILTFPCSLERPQKLKGSLVSAPTAMQWGLGVYLLARNVWRGVFFKRAVSSFYIVLFYLAQPVVMCAFGAAASARMLNLRVAWSIWAIPWLTLIAFLVRFLYCKLFKSALKYEVFFLDSSHCI